MFKFNIQSKDLAKAMGKLSIAIQSAKKDGNEGVMVSLSKEAAKSKKPMGILVAYDGKIQSSSAIFPTSVKADIDKVEVYVSGITLEKAAVAFAAYDTTLTITIDKDLKIEGAGSEVALEFVPPITTLKKKEDLIQEIQINTQEFIRLLQFGASCFKEEKGSNGMNCVALLLDQKNKTLSAVSANGIRCAYAESKKIDFKLKKTVAKAEGESEESAETDEKPTTIVVEGKVFRNIIKNLDSETIRLGVDSKSLWIRNGTDGLVIVTQSIPYPVDMLLQVFEKCKKTGTWKAPLVNINQAIGIYEITKESEWLKLRKGGDSQIILQGKNEQTKASIICAQEGQVEDVAVSAKELKAALSVFNKDGDVFVETSGGILPILMRQKEDDVNKIVVMPVADE